MYFGTAPLKKNEDPKFQYRKREKFGEKNVLFNSPGKSTLPKNQKFSNRKKASKKNFY